MIIEHEVEQLEAMITYYLRDFEARTGLRINDVLFKVREFSIESQKEPIIRSIFVDVNLETQNKQDE